ncbi:MAG: hypothetical protein RL514_918 [Verrucomicrobiota bacterium]|jgi:hypothetical protein
MKLNKNILTAAASLMLAASAHADFSIYITGSTAFRGAAYTSILSLYDAAGLNVNASAGTAKPFTTIANPEAPGKPVTAGTVTTYSGANAMAFSGTMPAFGSQIVTIYCLWSGSVEGIRDVTLNTSLDFLSTAVSQTSAFADAGQTTTADFAFSDVFQASTTYKTPTLQGTKVGVIPFALVKNQGAPANLTNISHQQAITLFANGVVSLPFITGDLTGDTNKVACLIGRYNGSGTRYAVFADTGYGALKSSVNYKYSANAGPGSTPAFTAVTPDPNVGHTSGSSVKTDVSFAISTALNAAGDTYVTGYAIGYLGVKDAYGVTGNGSGALNLTYDGAAYSPANVYNGTYTMWSYQHIYNKSGLSTDKTTFKANLAAAIPNNLGSGTGASGLKLTDMSVQRSVDGGPIGTQY